MTQLSDWLYTSNPPTRTLTRSVGLQPVTTTETISGKVTTETTEEVTVITATVTQNFIEPQSNAWYGSATSPCVSRVFSISPDGDNEQVVN